MIKGKDLDALSDDPDELQRRTHRTRRSVPPVPTARQIYIDGFTGGQLPPKSSIREIRINQNPFSAQYDKLGYGRIEILTKPGTDKFTAHHGDAATTPPSTRSTPSSSQEPSYYTTFANGQHWRSARQKDLVVLQRIPPQQRLQLHHQRGAARLQFGNPYNYSAAVANPQTRLDISPRFDFQLGDKNTLTVRYMLDRQVQTNSGVIAVRPPESRHTTSPNYENSLQVSDTQIINANTVNETRFQYIRAHNSQIAQNTDPTVTVPGAFTGGGSNAA